MYNTDLYKRVRSEVDKIQLMDMHEHLALPHELEEIGKIDFGKLFNQYACGDVVSAGMPLRDMENLRERTVKSGWSPTQKWQALKPYYQMAWNTGYCECIRIAMQDLYGIDDLRDDTSEKLSEKMNNVPRGTWVRTVFDKAGIDIAMVQCHTVGRVYLKKRYPELCLYDIFDLFSNLQIAELSAESGIDVYNMHDYLRIIDWYFDKYADEAAAFKIGRAYDRTLFFDDVSTPDASMAFTEYIKSNGKIPESTIKLLEDFIIHYCVRKAGEYNLPVKVHTGIQGGNGNDIKNSRAGLLTNLFIKYPKTKFDVFHTSWPYTEELISVCKNFQNVYIDFCWAWSINPPAARRYLSDMLETIPVNKIHGFGGDSIFVESSYGQSVMARREIARVLTKKVEEGKFKEEYAVWVAQRILRENGLENFNIKEKRQVYAQRAKEE